MNKKINLKRINIAFASVVEGKPEACKFLPVNADGMRPVADIVGVQLVDDCFPATDKPERVGVGDIYRTALACVKIADTFGAKCCNFVASVLADKAMTTAFNELQDKVSDCADIVRRAKNAEKAADGVIISAKIVLGNARTDEEKAAALANVETAETAKEEIIANWADRLEKARSAVKAARVEFNGHCADFVRNSKMWANR